jgi:hypothetical protein
LGKAIKSDNHQQLIHQIVIEILTMTIKEQLLQEIEKVPEPLLQEVLDFIQFLQNKRQ